MLLNDKVYNGLKFLALVLLPATAAAYFTLAQLWGFPNAEQVVGTIAVVETFLGVLVRSASKSWDNSDMKYDGTYDVVFNPEQEANLRMKSIDWNALDPTNPKKELVLRLDR